MELLVEGVRVSSDLPDFTKDEAICYIAHARKALGKQPLSLRVEDAGGGMVRVEWETNGKKFERIRRITGYLVGTIDRWNNAKKSEERERVKHG